MAITWESRAKEGRAVLDGCLEKLKTRTATVVNNLVVAPKLPNPQEVGDWRSDFLVLTSVGTAGVVLGLVAGIMLSN